MIRREKLTVEKMIRLYCKSHHSPSPCPQCIGLLDYALDRLEKCPFGVKKPVCGKCPKKCYRPSMAEKIRKVMAYSGPRMIYRHPVLTAIYLLAKLRSPAN